MKLYGDFHTHTKYSDGKGSVRESVLYARDVGLKHIAVTEHGFKHPLSGVSRRNFNKESLEIDALRAEFNDINILKGLEANLIGLDGLIDVTPAEIEKLDILVAGYHISPMSLRFKDNFYLTLPALVGYIFHKTPKQKLIDRYTEAYINMIKYNPVDIVSHPGYILKLDCFRVAKAAEECGAYIELSSRHRCLCDDDLKAMLKTDCMFIVNTDAHRPHNIGRAWELALEDIKRLGIPFERIANSNENLPKFRQKK